MTAPHMNLLAQVPLFSGGASSGLDDSSNDWLIDVAPNGHHSILPAGQPATTHNEPNTVVAPPNGATSGGQISQALDYAHGWVGTMYDWGGNGYDGRGVDCSGLIYNAFKRAGYNIQRYRAVDYGHMGMAVDPADAHPGDIVYFDNAGDTDHVGIYLGDDKFIESPQPGQRVQVSNLRKGAQIRRIFPGGSPDLPMSATGNKQYFAPDGQTYTGGQARGPQDDPEDVLSSLEVNADNIIAKSLAVEKPQEANDAALDSTKGDTTSPASAQNLSGGAGTGYLAKVLNALSGQESGGDYSVVNSIGARGKYQVMTANVGAWSQQVLGYRITPAQFSASPDLQERIVRGIFGNYVTKYGLRGALATWYSGKPGRQNDYSAVRGGPSVGAYVDQVIARMG